jgi:maspardin
MTPGPHLLDFNRRTSELLTSRRPRGIFLDRCAPADLKNRHGRVLIAESDTDVIGPRRRDALRKTYPQAQVHTFHNAGHAPMFTRYDEYLRMVQDFLK